MGNVQPYANGQPKRYSQEIKDKALEIFAEHGAAEASRQTGVASTTVWTWAQRAGVQQKINPHYSAMQRQRWEERRMALAHKIGEQAEKALERTAQEIKSGKAVDAKNMATTTAVLIDKAQLITGGATSRNYGVPNPEEQKKRAQELDELAEKRAKRVSGEN